MSMVSPMATVSPSNYLVNGKNMSNLMSNAEFRRQSMTQSQIQRFFENQNSMLQHEIAVFYLYKGEVQSANEHILPARQIHGAATRYNVNPKVILCTIQKESSIITNPAGASSRRVYYCMGYGATDGGDIEHYSGIDIQIEGGTSRLNQLYNESNWNRTLTVNNGRAVTINGTTYPSTLISANRATYALYRWTPWVFDTSLPPFGGGNYLFLQVKDMFWTSWN